MPFALLVVYGSNQRSPKPSGKPGPLSAMTSSIPVSTVFHNFACAHLDVRLARVADRLERILQQVVQQLAQAAGIGAQDRIARREAPRELDALIVLVQVQHFADQCVQRQRPRIDLRRSRIVAERIDHRLQRFDLGDDRVRGAIEQLRFPPAASGR